MAQIGFTFFEIGNQRLTTIFDVENAGKIANFLIQPVISHSFCRLPYISPVAFLVAHIPGET